MRVLFLCAPIVVFTLPLSVSIRRTHADEPNETFAQATVLDPGTLSVTDSLSPGTGPAPDTYLGVFGEDGFDWLFDELDTDDDSSSLGNGLASGLTNVLVNPDGSIAFIVTGNGDLEYDGGHEESGGYKALVEVFDSQGQKIDEFSRTGSLQPGVIPDQHRIDHPSWVDGTFSININNTVDGFTGGDVDFFTFTGLNAGSAFSAETTSIGTIDTLLGWYSDGGTLIAQDDDGGNGAFSRLTGTIPASGQLTFAVTGSGDAMFVGEHAEQEVYDLLLTIDGQSEPADFDGDGDVDEMDLFHPTLGWEARYGIDLDGDDFLLWQTELNGSSSSISEAFAVPEPESLRLLGFALLSIAKAGRRSIWPNPRSTLNFG